MDSVFRDHAKTFAEFFAGIGLMHYGLRASRWRCVYANDCDAKKAQMYHAHFGAADYYHLADVWDTQAVLEHWREDALLATASFPCTDMSLAGRRAGFGGRESSAFFGFVEVLARLPRRPPLVMLENVVGFATSRNGADFHAAVQQLSRLGYWLDAFTLDAKWFVPQSRPRLFLVGVQREYASPWEIPAGGDWLADGHQQRWRSSAALRPAALLRAMESAPPDTCWVWLARQAPPIPAPDLQATLDLDAGQAWWEEAQVERHLAMMTQRHLQQIQRLRQSGETAVATVFRRIRQGVQRAEPRWDGWAGCLRTPRGGSARQIVLAVIGGRVQMRWMTSREYARLQGASDFTIQCGERQALFGFGDAVCAPAIAWIDRHILSPLFQSIQAAGPITAP